MGKYDENYKRYKLFAIDDKRKPVLVFESTSIERLDDFTSQFANKNDLLAHFSSRYDIKFVDFYVESRGYKNQEQKGKLIEDIVYESNEIPSYDFLCTKFLNYLLEDRTRIRIYLRKYKPKFLNDNLEYAVSDDYLERVIRAKINSYIKAREVYFQLLDAGKINIKDDKKNNNVGEEIDHLYELLEKIKWNFPVEEPDDIALVDPEYSKDMSIVEKVVSGEYEPFEYLDLEDYERLKKGPRR